MEPKGPAETDAYDELLAKVADESPGAPPFSLSPTAPGGRAERRATKGRIRSLTSFIEPVSPPANDDQETIGALIRAMKSQKSRKSTVAAAVATAFWVLLCALFLQSESGRIAGNGFLQSEVLLALLAITGFVFALFLMVGLATRSQDMQVTTRALVKIVSDLADPEMSTASKVGVTSDKIRGEVAQIDNALELTLARASKLEALLRSEYLNFEQSLANNEQRLRGFLEEMAYERAAIVTNAEKVRFAIDGAHKNLSRDLDAASERFERLVGDATANITSKLADRSAELVQTAGAAGDRLTAGLSEALEGSIARAGTRIEDHGHRFADLLSAKGDDLDQKLRARITDASDLLDRQIEEAQIRALRRIEAMTTQIQKILEKMNVGISERGEAINTMLASRTLDIAQTLRKGGSEFLQTLDRTTVLADDLSVKLQTASDRLQRQAVGFNDSVLDPLASASASFDDKRQALLSALSERIAAIEALLADQAASLRGTLDGELERLLKATEAAGDSIRTTYAQCGSEAAQAVEEQVQAIVAALDRKLVEFAGGFDERQDRLVAELSRQADALETNARSFATERPAERALERAGSVHRGDAVSPRPASDLRMTASRSTIPATETAGRSSLGRASTGLSPASHPSSKFSAMDRAPSGDALAASPQGSLASAYPAVADHAADPVPADRVASGTGASSSFPSGETSTTSSPAQPTAATSSPIEAARPASVEDPEKPGALTVMRPPLATVSRSGGPIVEGKLVAPSGPSATDLEGEAYAVDRYVNLRDTQSGLTGKTWLSDLLARASRDEDVSKAPERQARTAPAKAQTLSSISTDIDTFIKSGELRAAWERYRLGDNSFFDRVYTPRGVLVLADIRDRLESDGEFRSAVIRYTSEFERLLGEVCDDGDDESFFTYLDMNAGKVYTLLAHASRRLA